MLSRTAASRAQAIAFRRAAVRSSRARFQTTASSSTASYGASHVAAGVAGGATVALAGYAWYHTSGLKTAVQTSKDVKSYLQSTRDTVVSKAKETAQNPSQALNYLRNVARSYAGIIPGASGYVDKTFDELDALRDNHGEDMDKIVSEAVEELQRTAKEGGADTKTAARVYDVLSNTIRKLQELGKKAGSDILERNPQIKEKLGGGYDQLVSLAGKAGPEGKKALDEVTQQIKDLVSKGKVDDESIDRLKKLLKEKSEEVQKLAGSSGKEALESGSVKLQALLSAVPGSEQLKEKIPNLEAILKIANERSQEAKQLAEETFNDVLNVLNEKGRKAKEITESTKEDAKKSKN